MAWLLKRYLKASLKKLCLYVKVTQRLCLVCAPLIHVIFLWLPTMLLRPILTVAAIYNTEKSWTVY